MFCSYHLARPWYPVRAATAEELHQAHRRAPGTRLRDARADLPTRFVQVVDRATAPDPKQRTKARERSRLISSDSLDGSATTERRWPIGTRFAALAATIAVVAGLGWAAVSGRVSPGATVGPIRSIAVLPLANLSQDPAQEYFADGMTDQLITMLSRLDGLNVISRTSVMQFKGSPMALAEIARMLHVDAVLEGTGPRSQAPAAGPMSVSGSPRGSFRRTPI